MKNHPKLLFFPVISFCFKALLIVSIELGAANLMGHKELTVFVTGLLTMETIQQCYLFWSRLRETV